MRTVWFSACCLVCLGLLVIGKASTSRSSIVAYDLKQSAVATKIYTGGGLTKSDRLEVAYVQEATRERATSFVEPMALPVAVDAPVAELKIKNRHWHQTIDIPARTDSSRQNPDKALREKRKSEISRTKSAADIKDCLQSDGFTGLLRAMNLRPKCRA